jgi:sigma-B regulation protein RsbU (phosphoserine phosphatase)
MGFKKVPPGIRPYWVYFTIAATLVVLLYTLYAINMVMWRKAPDFGWRGLYSSGPNVVAEVMEVAEAAGLRVGDTIKAINGQSYNTFDQLYFKILRREPGSVNVYTVVRDGKTMEFSITTGHQGLRTVLKRSGVLFAIGLVYVIIGVVVFLMKPQGSESWLFLVMTCFIGLTISYYAPSSRMRPLWLYEVSVFVEFFLAATVIHLALRFPKTRTFLLKKPWLCMVAYLLSLVLFVLYKITVPFPWEHSPVLGPLSVVYQMFGVLVFLLLIIWNIFKERSVLIRLQSKAIMVGITLGFFIPTINLVLQSFFHVSIFPNPILGYAVFLAMFPLSIGYTIVKHDLFAIDALIKRTYGYILTTAAIAGVYGLFVLVSNLTFGKFGVTRSPVFPLIFVLAVVFLFNPIRNRVQRFIDRVFYRLEYDYQETVQRISESMRTLLGLDEIGKSIMATALGTMFIDSGCVMLLNKERGAYECLTAAGEREKRRVGSETVSDLPAEKELEEGQLGESTSPIMAVEAAGTEVDELRISELKLPADEPLIQKIAEKKKEVTIYDIQEDPLFEDERTSCEKAFDQMEATLIVPLIYEDRLTGLISLGQKKSGKFYRKEDINLLNILANQGAVAIENAMMVEDVIEKERMEEELTIARDLQTSMLPATCPEIEGLEIAATSIPAREVGGDFFDFIDMGKDRAGLVIADVTGKSVSGALVMSASRSVFRMLSEEQLTVGEIMNRANRRTKKDIKSGMFVALLYAVIDARDQILSLSSAGQTQPIHVSAQTGEARLVETVGDTFPLGILEDADYQETRLQLAPGDKVVFYTDGIVEEMNEDKEIFGFERLLEAVQEARSMSADSLLKEVLNKVNEFAGGAAQHDDLTVIVLSVGK